MNAALLFLCGLLGAVAFEVIRWRKLEQADESGAFVKPLFVCLSAAFVLAGGGAGLIFGQLVPAGALQLATAFVGGAGLEELVKRAARLKIWSPDVHLGAARQQLTTLAFLRA